MLIARLVFGIGVLDACQSSTNETVDCPEALAAYCGTAPCVFHVDRNNVVESFCASVSVPFIQFGTLGCDDGGTLFVESSEGTFEYGADGALVAMARLQPGAEPFFACVAGPPTLGAPRTCMSNLVAYLCVRDAGTD